VPGGHDIVIGNGFVVPAVAAGRLVMIDTELLPILLVLVGPTDINRPKC
jgi:hypothetical protein